MGDTPVLSAEEEENEDDVSHGRERCYSHDNMRFWGHTTQQISVEVEVSFL